MNVFVKQKNGKMPRYGNIFNILTILYFDSATSDQIKRLYPNAKPLAVLKKVEEEGLVWYEDGKFKLTESGFNIRKTLASQFNME